MNFKKYGGNRFNDNDNTMWHDDNGYEGPAFDDFRGPAFDDFSDYMWHDQRAGNNRGRGGYRPNAAPFFHEPYQVSRPRFFWGRGYGPTGPPGHPMQPRFPRFPRENNPVSFLIRCGVLKQTLNGLPKVLLRLMEPQYCGVCAQEFDNFDGARLHYISKNHNKNQKKWLIQQAKAGVHRPKETPLKSRELYCELCDVQITSKIHAASHYAGAPHRAVVEGRKLPKNPFLLQENMQQRVQQLIRREKKFLKTVEKPEESEKETADSKAVPPELYCEICKTSVTCTEQMTMHLNGKKHLTREKRHILDMMKGGKDEAKSTETAINAETMETPVIAETTENAAVAQDANTKAADASGKGETNYYEDDFDWGQGSGKWEEDPQEAAQQM